jgi:hypothetical protein
MLTLGSAVLAVVNIVVMWGMAHRWRYAWHGNLGLQLLWLPYDTITKQYGLLALGAVMTVVSIKGCLNGGKTQPDTAVRSGPRHRSPRRGWFDRHVERADAADRANPTARLRLRRRRARADWQSRAPRPASPTGRRPGQLSSPGGVTGAVSSMPASRIAANRRSIAIEEGTRGCRDLTEASLSVAADEIDTDDEWQEIAAAGTGLAFAVIAP